MAEIILPVTSTIPINIFFFYAAKEKKLRDELEKRLLILQRQSLISNWHDCCVVPGKSIASEIHRHLQDADIILLLISTDLIISYYLYSSDMQQVKKRYATGKVQIIPILLRPTDGWESTLFGRLKALPSNGKSITEWPSRDLAFVDIFNGIRNVIEQVRKILVPPLADRSLLEPPVSLYDRLDLTEGNLNSPSQSCHPDKCISRVVTIPQSESLPKT